MNKEFLNWWAWYCQQAAGKPILMQPHVIAWAVFRRFGDRNENNNEN